MPELPEVETVVRDLRPHLTGRRLASVRTSQRSLRRPWRPDWNDAVAGRRVEAVRRRGKWIVLDLDGRRSLVLHLGMTGQLTLAAAAEPEQDHTHLVFGLAPGGGELRFRDVRRFGSATYFADDAERDAFFADSGLGPEPFDLEPADWKRRLAATERCLKAVLLDQRVAAGVGNIYADESLYQARLHPERPANTLTAAEAERLRRALPVVLNRAIEQRGASIRDYVGGSGLKGAYQNEFRVYGRAGQPCRRCRTAVVRVRLAGRSTHYCPSCQKAVSNQREQGV